MMELTRRSQHPDDRSILESPLLLLLSTVMPDVTDLPLLPDSLEDAQAQAVQAVQSAIAAGYSRLMAEILIPDIKPDVLAYPFHQVFDSPYAFVFADAGAAALAKRNWEVSDWTMCGVNQATLLDDDLALVVAAPSVVEVGAVEELFNQRNSLVSTSKDKDVPVLLLNPELQDAATVGIGVAGRKLRERFISTLEPCYYLQPLGTVALFRSFPHPWSVWQLNDSDEYELIDTIDHKPSGEELSRMFDQPGGGFIGEMARFIRALRN